MAIDPSEISLQQIFAHRQNAIFCLHQGRAISGTEMLNHAWQISHKLPNKTYGINLCQNRYHFTVAFLALLFRRQINLLPPNRAEQTIGDIYNKHPGSYCLIDSDANSYDSCFAIDSVAMTASTNNVFPEIDRNQTVSISFTSGSTGQPTAVAKTWREFQQCAYLATQQLCIETSRLTLISTVPAQHMYGLETSIFWPLYSELSINTAQPFYPEDIRRMMATAESPCLLISTPTHLKACANAGISWQNINMIVSSTAPMTPQLVAQIETNLQAPVFEIFGSTETLSFASRQATLCAQWQPYQKIQLTKSNHGIEVNGGHLQQAVSLDDHLDISETGKFTFVGRSSELIKVAGKRASLTELNTIINRIDGVHDAVFYPTEHGRLGALVVSKLTKMQIISELKQFIDVVFLPRPLHHVEHLPRNEVSKIIKTSLQQLISELDRA